MARNMNVDKGNPDAGRGPFSRLVKGSVEVEIPDGCRYDYGTKDMMGSVYNATIEDQTSGQARIKGARSGRGKRGGVV